MREGLIRVSVGTSSSPSAEANDANVTLRVEEGVSGVVLVDIDFTPAEWWRLITGYIRSSVGHVVAGDQIERIGKEMVTLHDAVPKDIYEGVKSTAERGTYQDDRDEKLQAGKRWAIGHWIDVPEPKDISVSWTNSGMAARCWHYVEPKVCDTCGRLTRDHDYLDVCK